MRKLITLLLVAICGIAYSQIPQLQSRPQSTNVVYMNFGGQVVNNPNWSSSVITALPSTLTSAQIIEVYNRVAAKFVVFDVNITTVQSVYNAAQTTKRTSIVITPTSQWYGSAGGVAFVGSWGYINYEPAWAFENMLSYNAKYVADAVAHEIGHTLWLNHHGKYDASCNRTSSYHNGIGSGETSWCPIMGAGYSVNVGQWAHGTTTTLQCFGNVVDDLQKITTSTTIGILPDDVGNTTAAAKTLALINNQYSDSGIITLSNDVDVYKITLATNGSITINCRPYSLNTSNNDGSMLDTRIRLMTSSGVQLALDSNINKLNSSITSSGLSAGVYYIEVASSGHPNYTDYGYMNNTRYGSIGKYYISGSVTTQPQQPMANFNIQNSVCKGQNISTVNTSINATSYQWTCTNGQSSTLYQPTFTFNDTGTFVVTLVATNAVGSNTLSQQVNVNPLPVYNILGNGVGGMCINSTVTLNVGSVQGQTYTWSPSVGLSSTTGNVVCFATTTTTYTITITNQYNCTALYTYIQNVYPLPVPSISYTLPCSYTNTLGSASVIQNYVEYLWSNGATTQSIGSITSGMYKVTVKDINNCYGRDSVLLSNDSQCAPQCSIPTFISSGVSCHGCVVNWSYVPNATKYRIRYKKQNQSNWIQQYTTNTLFAAPIQNTNTQFQVKAICGSDSTVYSATYTVNNSFNVASPTVTYNYITGASIQIQWTNTNSLFYNIRYRKKGTTAWSYINGVIGNSYTITGLQQNTSYNIGVQSVCYGVSSTYSKTVTYKTLNALRIDEIPKYEGAYSLYNIIGQEVWSGTYSEYLGYINNTILVSGVYVLTNGKQIINVVVAK